MSHENTEFLDFEELAHKLETERPELGRQQVLLEEAEAFAERVRDRLRRARGKTSQSEMARRMGVSHQSRVSRIETGDAADLTLEILYRYADALGFMPVVSLVPKAGFLPKPSSPTDAKRRKTARRETEMDPGERLARDLGSIHERTLQTLNDDLVHYLEEVTDFMDRAADVEDKPTATTDTGTKQTKTE